MTGTLLSPDEPPACVTLGEPSASPFLLVCDHAGNRIPRRLGTLGVSDSDRQRHIAWDIGAAGVTRQMAERLGAFAILQSYSRLVIDCNRDPDRPDSVVEWSDGAAIPGNIEGKLMKLRIEADLPPQAHAQVLSPQLNH